jgi:hypothetical protein
MEAAKFAGGTIAVPKLAQWLRNNPGSVRRLSQGVTSPTARAPLEKASKNGALAVALMCAPAAGLKPPLPLRQQ